MADYTTNLNLEKPADNENFRRQVLNDNMDKIDKKFGIGLDEGHVHDGTAGQGRRISYGSLDDRPDVVERGEFDAHKADYATTSATGHVQLQTTVDTSETKALTPKALNNHQSDNTQHILNGKINDANGNELLKFTTTTSAVNEVTIKNATTGNGPEIQATGNDTNIDLRLIPKGTGIVYATKITNAIWNDYAEYFERNELTEPGDIIMLNPNGPGYVKAVGFATKLVRGVHSDSYGHILGGNGDKDDIYNFIPVGLVGRVHVKINGVAKKGQYVVASNILGVGIAVDNILSGAVLGQLEEDKTTEEIGKVRMFIMRV